MRKLLLALAVVAALTSAAPALAAEPAAAPTPTAAVVAARCSSITYGGTTYILFHRGVSCGYARYWILRLNRTKRGPSGWRCESGTNYTTGGGCAKGPRRTFGWHPGD